MISVVIPCYNEEPVLDTLYRRLTEAARTWGEEYEVIAVDDGSLDGTWQKLVEIHQRDGRWRAIRFSRNFGHQTAISAGMAEARGQAVVILDADLQDPPEVVNEFLAKWREGYHVVYGIRRRRKEGLFKKAAYFLFYRILRSIAATPIPVDSGDFCLMDRCVVDILNRMPERNRFVRGLRAWTGFRQIGVEYERQARAAGQPQYTFKKLLQLAIDGIFSFSVWPLRLATRLGLLVSTFAFLGVVFTFLQRIYADWFDKYLGLRPVPGFATTVIAILFLGGVQLICLGIIGEYIGRIYEEVKGRPLWIICDRLDTPPATGPAQTSTGGKA
ncbi:MAG: glycosyltransferase family 2 protein [Thermoguttaceae bacterium]|nr:glycosyltransferase family 2 protein [Thermoguttaceae bacterium]MDW8078918.1 glycosyltransferase family 2 protein [Thermoguttaceae bacterium]